jgi:putative endonuclease
MTGKFLSRSEATKQSPAHDGEIASLPTVARNDTSAGVVARSGFCDEAIPKVASMSKQYYVYIMTNKYNTVLYTGVTNDLKRRVYEHKSKLGGGFTSKYNITKLVYYEVFDDVNSAIAREKQIKGGSRQKKIDLINGMNSEWKDLYEEL